MTIEPSRRLLVLDDDERVGALVEAIGRMVGLSTMLTAEPAAFFAAVKEWQPTLLFLDLTMPLMAGEQVLRGLARHRCTARIILSGGEPQRRADAAELARRCGLALAGTLPETFTPAALRALLV